MKPPIFAIGAMVVVIQAFPAATSSAAPATRATGQIAFTSNRTGTAQIWIMNADGSKQKRLTHSDPMEDIHPAWSPDGKQILFVRGSPVQAPYDVWLMNADGSKQRQITTTGESTYATWSPDGRKIAYLTGSAIWVLDKNGRNARVLTKVGPNYVPSWAPGKRILFTSERDGGGKQVYMMNPDGSRQIRITKANSEDKIPTWSPDGRHIAFARGIRECSPVACQIGTYEIYTMDADGSHIRRLTFTAMPERGFGENYPVWRPTKGSRSG